MEAFTVTFHNADKNTFRERALIVEQCEAGEKVQIHQQVFHKKALNPSLILIS